MSDGDIQSQDEDAAIMARAQEILARECLDCPCGAEYVLCPALAALAVRIAKMESRKMLEEQGKEGVG